MSRLEDNAEARDAFERMGRAAQSGFRQALRFAGMPLPSWAADRRASRNVEQCNVEHCRVVTPDEVVTHDPLNAVPNVAQCHSATIPDESDDALNALYG